MLMTRPNLKGRSFLAEKDFTQEELLYFLDLAAELKEKKKNGVCGYMGTTEGQVQRRNEWINPDVKAKRPSKDAHRTNWRPWEVIAQS